MGIPDPNKDKNQKIDYLKRVITKIFSAFNTGKGDAIIAMSELIVYALSQGCKDQKELETRFALWYEQCFKEAMHTSGPSNVEMFKGLEELDKKNPGVVEAIAEAMSAQETDIKIVFLGREELKDIQETDIKGNTPPSQTRH